MDLASLWRELCQLIFPAPPGCPLCGQASSKSGAVNTSVAGETATDTIATVATAAGATSTVATAAGATATGSTATCTAATAAAATGATAGATVTGETATDTTATVAAATGATATNGTAGSLSTTSTAITPSTIFFSTTADCFCNGCRALIETCRQEPHCTNCGRLPVPGRGFITRESSGLLCSDCRGRRWPFTRNLSVVPYEGIFKETVHLFKYAGRRGLAIPLADLMAVVAKAEPELRQAGLVVSRPVPPPELAPVIAHVPAHKTGLVVPVPMAPARLRQRGFNQAELLARELGALLRVPVNSRALVKASDTPAQAGLTRAAREMNPAGAFKVVRPREFEGRSVLLVDDVFTTGSTMTACAAALRDAGAARVYGLVFAAGRCY